MSLTTRHSLKYLRQWVRVNRPLLLRPHPPGVPVTPCLFLEKEDCHYEDANLREVRVPCGGGHEPLQGLSLPGHLDHLYPPGVLLIQSLLLEKDEGNDLRIPCLCYLPLPRRGGRRPLVLVTPSPPGHQP